MSAGKQNTTGPTEVTTRNSLQGSGSGYGQFAAQAGLSRAIYDNDPQSASKFGAQVDQFRANAFFSDSEWKTLDQRLIEVREDEVPLFDELRGRGLATTTDLSTIIYEYEKAPAQTETNASISMGLEDRAQDEIPSFGEAFDGIPLPIVHKSFHLNERTLRVDNRAGTGVQSSAQDAAARGVINTLDDMLINGWGATVDGYDVPGLRTFADRNTMTAQNWQDTLNTTAAEIRGDLLTAVERLEGDGYDIGNDGYVVFLSRAEYQTLRRRTVGTEDSTQLMTRLNEEFDYIDFARTTSLPAGEALMFKAIPEVMEFVVASDLQNVEWESHAGFTTHMKVMASITPLIKSTATGQSGIVHMTGLQG